MSGYAFALLAEVAHSAEHEREVGVRLRFEVDAGLGDGRIAPEIRGRHIVAVDASAAFCVELVFPGSSQVPAEGLWGFIPGARFVGNPLIRFGNLRNHVSVVFPGFLGVGIG